MKLLKAMATVAGLTGISRIFGFIRDILTAAILGAGLVADAFFVALKLPNFFRRVTAEGAFSVSFVPMYSGKLEQDGQGKADEFASNAFAMMLVFLVPFTLLALFAMPWIIYGIAPGFEGGGERYELAVELSRVTFPYLLLMSLTALMGGMMNALGHFAAFASAPILFNLCLIGALLFAVPHTETAGHAMAWGVLAAGGVQFLWLVFCVKKAKAGLKLRLPKFNGDMKQLFKLMGPGVIGAGVMHINLFADLIIASLLPAGSISYLYYADRLNQLPLGIVGIAVGTALLPMLSKAIAGGHNDEARNLFNRAMEVCLLLAVPAAVALFIVPQALITVLFERGAFSAADTDFTASVLMGYAVGLPAYVAAKVLSTGYWARQDTMTPVKIAVIATVSNIILALILIWPFGVAGISISTGLSGWIQFWLLKRGLKGQKIALMDGRFKRATPRMLLSACIMGAVLYSTAYLTQDMYDGTPLLKIFALIILVALGLISYAIAVLISGAIQIKDFKTYFRKDKA